MSVLNEDPVFQQWMLERYDHWGLIARALLDNSIAAQDAVVETIKRICGMSSRQAMTVDRDIVERFERLVSEFYRDLSLDFKRK